MSEEIWNPEKVIDQDAVDSLTDEQASTVLEILERAGY